MKPDSHRTQPAPAAPDRIERAHLKDPGDASHVIHRYDAGPALAGLAQRFWIPVWSVPPGAEAPQRVLQYPVALVVVSPEYARFYGVAAGLSTTTLTGDGWAVGVMCTPAAGSLIAGESMARWTDRYEDVSAVLGPRAQDLVTRVRAAMAPDPTSPAAHRAAMRAFDDALRPSGPVDPEGKLVNRLVELVESRSDVVRVAQVCAELDLSERALQRLVRRRVGLSPKWLIQRRRLHEAAELLRLGTGSLAEIAASLGYADQPHFVRDFSRVTGTTPGRFAARHLEAAGRR